MRRILIFSIIFLFSYRPIGGQQKKDPRIPPTDLAVEKQAQQPLIAEAKLPVVSPEALPFFGHNAFAVSEEMLKNYPVSGAMFPERYCLGPGDRLGIYLLGKFQQTFDIVVNAEGKILIPTVGVFYVADLTIEELHTLLEKQLARYYDNFSLNIMLIEPKKVPVMVVGEVNQPGKYLLSSLNTVPDALVMAGGPSINGSLRNIQVYRQDRLLTTIDLYQFLMTGKIENETFLQRNDRIIVPVLDAVVVVSGEVKRQARFELKHGGNERLSDIIYLASGFKELADLDKIEISRLLVTGERSVFYVNYHQVLADENSPMNVVLKNDDHIHVYSVQEQTYPKYVYIDGEVKRPGQYPLEQNLRVLDLILKAGNLTRSAYLLQCDLAKIDPKQPVTYLKINLQRLLADPQSSENYLLEEDDRLFIRRIPEWEVGWTVEIQGEVQFPGVYAITKDSTTLAEIIEKAGGFTREALIREASLIRHNSKVFADKEYERLKLQTRDQMSKNEYQYLVMRENTQDISRVVVDFYKLCVLKKKSEDVILEDGDVIMVPKIPQMVYVTGRVGVPGGVRYQPKKNIGYYLKKAGGPAWDAKTSAIKVTKVTGQVLDDEHVSQLEPGDIIWVPRRPDRDWWEVFRQTIAILAQIATIYIITDNALKK